MKPVTSSNIDPITLHSAQAQYYKYRTPYLPALFATLAEKLRLKPGSALLDICCGRGEVAAGFSNYVDTIFAIEGSSEMLAHAVQNAKITYSQCDVNAETFKTPVPVDHFVIGRAIHWVAPESLRALVKNNLKDGGKIAVCSAQWHSQLDWYFTYLTLTKDYPFGDTKFDYTGKDTLSEIGFKVSGQFTVPAKFNCTIDYLINECFATRYAESLEKLTADADSFKSRMINGLSPYLKNGVLEGEITNWAILYEKQLS